MQTQLIHSYVNKAFSIAVADACNYTAWAVFVVQRKLKLLTNQYLFDLPFINVETCEGFFTTT
jgi:hypothetical protein